MEVALQRYRDLKIRGGWQAKFMEALAKATESRPILWSDEAGGFFQLVLQEFQGLVRSRVPWSVSPLLERTKEFFPEMRGVLLPPTRTIQFSAPISTNEIGDPSGKGILNNLFAWKNSVEGSEERALYLSIEESFRNLSEGYRFDIVARENNNVYLLFSNDGSRWIPGDECGLGLSDLLVILYHVTCPRFSFIAIEEPETHIHPSMQRRLLAYLKSREDHTIFVSTHSNVFLDPTYVGKVVTASFNERVCLEDMTNRAFVLSDLGYSVADNLVSDHLILCEGPSDVPVLNEFLRKMGVLDNFNIKVLPLGGDIMDQVDLSVFAERARVRALVDKDPGSSRVRKRFQKACEEHRIPVHVLKRYSIENYFSLEAIRAVFADSVPEDLKRLDPRKKVQNQLGFNIKKSNREIAKLMDISEIEGTDLKEFLDTVAKECKETP